MDQVKEAALAQKAEKEKWVRIAGAFHALTRTEGWDTFTEQLGLLENNAIQQLIAGGADKHDYNRGFIEGLRTAYNMPYKVVEQVAKG
jgi:hypothetical protein